MRVAVLLLAVGCVLLAPVLGQGQSSDSHGAKHVQVRAGDIAFANSGSKAAQAPFLEGLALLHDFEYERAAGAFRRAETADPSFAMAYWGEAMTHNHGIWMEQDLPAARAVLSKLGSTPDARARSWSGGSAASSACRSTAPTAASLLSTKAGSLRVTRIRFIARGNGTKGAAASVSHRQAVAAVAAVDRGLDEAAALGVAPGGQREQAVAGVRVRTVRGCRDLRLSPPVARDGVAHHRAKILIRNLHRRPPNR